MEPVKNVTVMSAKNEVGSVTLFSSGRYYVRLRLRGGLVSHGWFDRFEHVTEELRRNGFNG